MLKNRNFLLFFAIISLLVSGCNEKKAAVGIDYGSRGSKSLLEKPYPQLIEKIGFELKKDPLRRSKEARSAIRDLQELTWLYYDEPSFFVFIAGNDVTAIAEEGVDNLQRFLENIEARDMLVSLCSHRNDRFRDQALYYLSHIHERMYLIDSVLPMAKRMLRDESEVVRFRAVKVIGEIEGRESYESLRMALQDPAPSVRGESMIVLSFCRGKEPGPLYRESLTDPSPYVRACAVTALANSGARECSKNLMDMIEDGSRTFYSIKYSDGNFYSFNGPERTVGLAVLRAMERLYDIRFSGNIPECRIWWSKYKRNSGNVNVH